MKVTIQEGGRVEAQKDEYSIFEGGVTIEYQDIKLAADKVTFNQRTRDVVAEGNVIIDQGPTRVTATQAIYNLDTKTGTFFNATATMEPSMYFSGDRIEKIDADTYRMSNGIFTSCDLDRPAWSFHVGSAVDYVRDGINCLRRPRRSNDARVTVRIDAHACLAAAERERCGLCDMRFAAVPDQHHLRTTPVNNALAIGAGK